MDWTDESITRLRSLWQEGLSTAEIGRRMQITKNAVVGKAHRLSLPPRPSPIRKGAELASTALQPQHAVPAQTDPVPPSAAVTTAPAPVRAQMRAEPPATVAVPRPGEPDNVQLLRPAIAPALRWQAEPHLARVPVPRSPADAEEASLAVRAAPPPRRRGLTCCWPLGEPGTKQFTFCGGEPVPGKPYCAQHAALAYVKIRDRRDSVA